MRIAHLTWSLGIGGAQTLLAQIANLQIREGHEVAIFEVDTYVSEAIVKELDPRIKVFYLGRRRGHKAVLPFIRLNWFLWKYHPDIIHSHAGKLIKVVFSSVPKIATIHGMKDYPKDYKRYKAVYAISQAVHDDWVRKGNPNTIVIQNGIDCNSIRIKANYQLGEDIHAVVVSRIYLNVKGQDIVVRALALLKEIRINKNLIVHFVGGGVDTDKLRQLAKKLDVADQVVFEGFKEPQWVSEHLCEFDLFIQASRWEGFGLTVAEACAAKLPVIISNIDGPLEIIDGGKLGATFQSNSHESLAKCLETFMTGGYDYSLIDKAYQRTIDNYDVTDTAYRYIEEYKRILNEKKE